MEDTFEGRENRGFRVIDLPLVLPRENILVAKLFLSTIRNLLFFAFLKNSSN